MGIFDRFRKEENQDIDDSRHYDNNLLEIVRIVSFNDKAVLEQAQNCVENTVEYYQSHKDDYEERGISLEEDYSLLQWIGCIDLLRINGYVCECDWKETREDFFLQIASLKGMSSLALTINSKWLDAEQDITVWCEEIGEKWKKAQGVIGAFDIDSDSFVMFVCRTKDLERLMALAAEIEYRIDYAEKM